MGKQAIREFKFSILITNPKKINIEETAINCLINQSIGFKKNIQIILIGFINEEIKKYQVTYPNNIIFIDSDSIHKSELKKEGLGYCDGKYVNFISHKNSFSKTTLEEVYNFFEKNENNIDMVSIPAFSAEKNKINGKYTYFTNFNSIVDLNINPQNFVISNQSSFYKTSVLKNIELNTTLGFNSDIDLNFKMYRLNQKFGYVCTDAQYFYKKNNEDNEKISPKKFHDSITVLNDIVLDDYDYAREFVLYESLDKLHRLKKEFFEEVIEYDNVIEGYRACLNKIDDNFIFGASKIVKRLDQKYFIIKIKNLDGLVYNQEGNIVYNNFTLGNFNDTGIKIKKINLKNNNLFIDVMFNDHDIETGSIKLLGDNSEEVSSYFDEKVASFYDINYTEFKLNEIRLVKFKVPLVDGNLSFNFVSEVTGNFKITNTSMLSFLKLSLSDNVIKLFHRDYSVSFDGVNIKIVKDERRNITYNLKTFIHILKKYKFLAFSRLLSMKNKKYVLINDRPEKAGDNGEALFKYINSNEKELAKKTYFILAKKNKEYRRMRKLGKVVLQNSLKHKFLFMNSKLITSSHAAKQFYTPFKMELLKYYTDLVDYKFVWLQHGVIHNNVSKSVNKYNANIDYFVVSSYREKQEVELDRYFYDKEDIVLTGLPRFDYLESDVKKVISVVPTWRRTLSGRILSCGFHETKEGFEESQYYNEYAGILESERLQSLLEKYDFTLNFNIHPGMAGYETNFHKFENSRIKIISAYEVEYKKIFMDSNILVTDYSSVAFDFSYLRKPLIYFQFDREDFYRHQYEQGYFDYTKDGFGEVIETREKLIDKIEYYLENNFTVEQDYLDKISGTFAHIDRKNCERIIEKIKEEKII